MLGAVTCGGGTVAARFWSLVSQAVSRMRANEIAMVNFKTLINSSKNDWATGH
jgi:hypothetical protein